MNKSTPGRGSQEGQWRESEEGGGGGGGGVGRGDCLF